MHISIQTAHCHNWSGEPSHPNVGETCSHLPPIRFRPLQSADGTECVSICAIFSQTLDSLDHWQFAAVSRELSLFLVLFDPPRYLDLRESVYH